MGNPRLDLLGNIDRLLNTGLGHLLGMPFANPGKSYTLATGVPIDGTKGYRKSCLWFNTINGGLYVNTGTHLVSAWTAIPLTGSTLAALTVTALTTPALTLTGTETNSVGASTAAAGTDETNAGALPAGTARTYPTTAADDTKGVIISTSDKVTGRTLLIGNGVSNKILKVYPPAGGTINGAAANAAFSSASGKGVIIQCLSGSGNTWLAW